MTQDNSNDLIVTTTLGQLRGQRSTSVYDDVYYSFERIPYAQPPLGVLRFRAPVPATAWSPEILNCCQKAQKPVQKNPLTNAIEGAEDCLYLNIYVKELSTPKPLPVLAFLHGGAFERGDASRDLHGPDYFMSKNVILVTIGYRLGPLGFMRLKDPSLGIPGNAGLKDQLLALQWVKQHIGSFNGDNNNITLFGESAGAASTHFLMLTPQARGLFHKSIMQSGTVLCPWAIATAEQLEYRLAQANGYTGTATDEADILKYLQELTPEQLVQPQLLTAQENLNDSFFAFGPMVEAYETETCIIPREPLEMLSNAWGNQLPLLIGGTSFEGLLMYARVRMAPLLLSEMQRCLELFIPQPLKRKYTLDQQKMLGLRIKQMHFDECDVNLEHIMKYCDYASYKVFWHPILRALKARLSDTKCAPTFLYRFDYDSPSFNHQRIKYCGRDMRGVAHVDDHSYLFYGDFSWKLDQSSSEYKTILRMIDIWSSFAEMSNPNCEELKDVGVWQPLSAEIIANKENRVSSLLCLNISNDLKYQELPELTKLQVWESLYDELLT